jgi:two-component system phosphate regulon response regulator PhoB
VVKSTVLIVGAEPAFSAGLESRLAGDECEVVSSARELDGAPLVSSLIPDAVVATERLSDADLLKLCRRLRNHVGDQHLALVLFVSDGDDAALQSSPEHDAPLAELLAHSLRDWLRVAANFRDQRDRLSFDELEVDRKRFVATLAGRALPLTPTEFRLLWILARDPGRVFSRSELSSICARSQFPIQPRTIDVHVKAIRQKLADAGQWIETVRGVGYRLQKPGQRHGCATREPVVVHPTMDVA